MALTQRSKSYVGIIQKDLQLAKEKEEQAKIALKAINNSLKMLRFLYETRITTYKDLLSHRSLTADHAKLTSSCEKEEKNFKKQIKAAKRDQILVRQQLSAARNEITILQTLMSNTSEKKSTPQLKRTSSLGTLTFFGPRNPLANELIKDLNKYIDRIKSHRMPGKETIDFQFGFKIDKRTCALNRMVNYYLAKKIVEKLKRNEPLDKVFSEIEQERALLIANNKIYRDPAFIDRGIKSIELNKIIKKGKSAAKNGKQEPSQGCNKKLAVT